MSLIAVVLFTAALWNRAGHYISALWFIYSSFFLSFSSPNLSDRRVDVCHTSTHGVAGGPSANLECMSEMCSTRLAGNIGRKKSPSEHHRTTLSGCISATKARIDNRKKLTKQQYVIHICPPQYGELRPSSGWDLFASLGHPSKFQRVSHLGKVTARHSSRGRQPNFAALTRAPPIFGRAAITLGIGPHSSW